MALSFATVKIIFLKAPRSSLFAAARKIVGLLTTLKPRLAPAWSVTSVLSLRPL
jgi:hypothetical protein